MNETQDRRHPAEITAARLAGHLAQWHTRMSSTELQAIGNVRYALLRIALEDLTGHDPDDDDDEEEPQPKGGHPYPDDASCGYWPSFYGPARHHDPEAVQS